MSEYREYLTNLDLPSITGGLGGTGNGGTTIISGSGGGTKTYGKFSPRDFFPSPTGSAAIGTRASAPVIVFSESVLETAVFADVMPEGASLSNGVDIEIKWSADSSAGSCTWAAELMKLDGRNPLVDTYASASTITTPAPSGLLATTIISVSNSNVDSIDESNAYRLKLYRNSTDGADTMTGDAFFYFASINGK